MTPRGAIPAQDAEASFMPLSDDEPDSKSARLSAPSAVFIASLPEA
jgi:hypothetical protein